MIEETIKTLLRRETIKALRRKGYRLTTILSFSWSERIKILLAEKEEDLIWKARVEFRGLCLERQNHTFEVAAQRFSIPPWE